MLAWSGGAGAVPGDAATTQYRIGSITKTFVAVLVLRLRDEGLLALDDRLGQHVPDAPLADVTIAQVLSHAAGFRAETGGPWWERTAGGDWHDLLSSIGRDPALFRPGERFHYSNVGFAVLGELVARLRGASWDRVVAQEILKPLGMAATTTQPVSPHAEGLAVHPFADVVLPEPAHDAGAMAPAGQLWSTLADLACWATFLGGDSGDVLAADTLEEMRQPLAFDDRPGEPWTVAFGLGVQVWNVAGRRFVGHGGSMPGFVSLVRVDSASGDGIVVMTNTTAGFGPKLTEALVAVVDEEPRRAAAWEPRRTSPGLLALSGHWFWGPATFVLRVVGEDLVELRPTGEGRGSRFSYADGRWSGLDGYFAGEELRVVAGDDGDPSHLDIASFVFTRQPYDADAPIPGGLDAGGWR